MKRLNVLFTLSSLNVLLVTVERFSFTTQVLLQPYNFIRLHEIVQITTLILFTVLIPIFVLKELTDNFEALKSKLGCGLLLIFITGIYFYATGNGLHEVSSFNFNNFCDTQNFTDDLCGSMFINDYYTGNIFYFFGAILMVVPLLVFEKLNPVKNFTKKDMVVTAVNATIFALAIFAYAGFDRVLVGLVYSIIIMFVALGFFARIRKKYWNYPYITYTTLAYTLGTLAAFLFRLK